MVGGGRTVMVMKKDVLKYLNTNLDLYGQVKKAEQECHMLSEEAQRGVRNLRVDFERGGIHLCPEKLDRVNKLNIEICQLCREYNENIVMDPGTVDIYPSSRIPKNLHYLVKPIYSSKSLITKDLSGSRGTLKEKGFRITTDPQTLTSVLQFSSDDEVRKIVYIRGNSVPHANVDVLKRLISARHELAQIMGCRSYAEFSVKPNISVSPKVVTSFLLEMSKMVQAKCIEERKLVMKFKREKCSQSDGDLRPWHETYYMTMMESSAYKLNSSSLFGATFCIIPLAPGESWDPHVLKLSLYHPEVGDLGYLYLDLYSREGKYPGCAHFAIKRTRRISQTEYQLPIVVLVFNLSGAWNSSAVSLSHWEVETLFHEFGHALQSLLSRTDYQHFSGTRTVLDFAEIPSNLFEHCSTGEEIPQKLVKSMQGARDMFAATDLQRQIFYALVGEQPFPHTPGNSVPRQHV
ncbi:Mitochondrial intermediate peptidase, mitochondrial [Glycine max]|nr:Mitochondrial intermediate peptidase, mitochondrial [Glycine max]